MARKKKVTKKVKKPLKKRARKRTKNLRLLEKFADPVFYSSLDIDVRPMDFLASGLSVMGDLFAEMYRQWPNDSRIGTAYVYFDLAGDFHMHMTTRGPVLRPFLALADVPIGHLPDHAVCPAANVADSLANQAAYLMVSMNDEVSADDPRWQLVVDALRDIQDNPKTKVRRAGEPLPPDWVKEHAEKKLPKPRFRLESVR